MERRIEGFRQDESSDWIAVLECGHGRHTRHDPPWTLRPWVLTEGGRAEAIGSHLACVRCERRELPEGYGPHHRTPTFDASSIPKGLLSKHTTKPGVWALIHVLSGRLRYRLHAPFDEEQHLDAESPGVVLPGVEHEVEPDGDVEFFVEFHRRLDVRP